MPAAVREVGVTAPMVVVRDTVYVTTKNGVAAFTADTARFWPKSTEGTNGYIAAYGGELYWLDFDGTMKVLRDGEMESIARFDSERNLRRFFIVPRGDQGDLRMYVIHESRAERGPGALLALGLTSREAKVLYWIAQGKSNPDIATIISTSVRTVHKHVENIFRKLGLETRNAAALAALELLKPDSLRDA